MQGGLFWGSRHIIWKIIRYIADSYEVIQPREAWWEHHLHGDDADFLKQGESSRPCAEFFQRQKTRICFSGV